MKQHDADIGLEFQALVDESVVKRGWRRHEGLTDGEVEARETIRLKLVTRHGLATRAVINGGN